MQIRRASAADADGIARIINAAFEIERSFRRGPRTSPAEVLAMMTGDTVLAVDSSVRRGGIGRALVETAEAHCRAAGCSVMTMSTGENRTELIPYYEKMGYRVTSIEPSANPAFKLPIRVVTMEKPL